MRKNIELVDGEKSFNYKSEYSKVLPTAGVSIGEHAEVIISQPYVQKRLRGIAKSVGRGNPWHIQQDLMQEATIHLWKMLTTNPGQTLRWYFKGCVFHLQHYLQAGRSVDSLKRGGGRAGDSANLVAIPDPTVENVESIVGASQIIEAVVSHLEPKHQGVLRELTNGKRLVEIAGALKLPLPTVRRIRGKIADLVASLHIAAPGCYQR